MSCLYSFRGFIEQFNAQAVEILDGKPSNITVNENLEASRTIIKERLEKVKQQE